jgi:hypothetical protein
MVSSVEEMAIADMKYSVVVGTDYSQTLIKEAENGVEEESTETPAPFHILAISSLFGQQQHILLTDNTIVERITHETLLPVLVVPPQQNQ